MRAVRVVGDQSALVVLGFHQQPVTNTGDQIAPFPSSRPSSAIAVMIRFSAAVREPHRAR
ncbi:hypothetical protein [Actinomadura sp. HBU206391]|uniref:hypothetical protein n=1 Tax=Actinomadura sp. HBU206391 TaxID=2731692 RepID=UPI00164F925D|nr:hypothetical protein [Actinomadura sp. HBU206391]MBC6462839.1 hypothetical protein [Actinomadura sp. HBU206391]